MFQMNKDTKAELLDEMTHGAANAFKAKTGDTLSDEEMDELNDAIALFLNSLKF